jgi:glutathione reductase (NADPH)
VFVGGGFISFELAHFAARLGPPNLQAVILEAAERPLSQFDAQMVSLLVEATEAEGISVRTGARISAVETASSALRVRLDGQPDIEADLVVHGAGRTPEIVGLGLEAAGIESSEAGITVDARMRTSNPSVYAAGDCAATLQLARVADLEAAVAAANILGHTDGPRPLTIDYDATASVLFTYPQYGMVGKTEAQLAAAGVDYRKSASDHLGWPTYRRIGMRHAAFKVLAGTDGRILGAHVISDHASGLLNIFRTAMMTETTAEALYWQNIMGPYPSHESDILYMLKPLMD